SLHSLSLELSSLNCSICSSLSLYFSSLLSFSLTIQMDFLPPELISFLLSKLDRLSLLNASLTSSKFRNSVIRHHSHFAFSPIIGLEIHGSTSTSVTIRSFCRQCAAHSSPREKDTLLEEKIIENDETEFLSFLSSILLTPARCFDVSIKDVSSSLLSIISDSFVHRSSSSPLPIRSFCIKTRKGTDETALHQLLQSFHKPILMYLHIWNLSTLKWDSQSMASARTVCLRSDVFAPLPSNIRIRPFGDTTDEMRREMKEAVESDDIINRLIQECNNSCEHKHLFQLNRMGVDHSLHRLCSSFDPDGQPSAIPFHFLTLSLNSEWPSTLSSIISSHLRMNPLPNIVTSSLNFNELPHIFITRERFFLNL
ncbi:hypothetical protein PENTCL1PPCAC_17820, partial [Pristionchus entomophagus]